MTRPERTIGTRRASRRAWPVLFAGAVAVVSPLPALAAMACNVASGAVAFGDYDPTLTTPDDSTGTIVVTCTRQILVDPFNISYTLSINRGVGSTSFSPRRMSFGTNRLPYNLYADAARAQIWGDGTSATVTVPGSASFTWFQTSSTVNHSLHGRIPPAQDVAPGNYTDTVVVTVTY